MHTKIAQLLAVLAWLLPNHYPPWANFHSESLALAAILIMCCAAIRQRSRPLQVPASAIVIVVTSLIPLLQWAGGIVFFIGDALISTLYLLVLAITIVIWYSSSPDKTQNSKPLWLLIFAEILLVAALASALMGFLQWLSLTGDMTTFVTYIEPGERVMANLGQPNQFATLLLMGILALCFLFEAKKLGYFALALGSIFMGWVIVLTGSRTALLGSVTVVCFLLFKVRKKQLRLSAMHLIAWLVCFLGFWLIFPGLNNLLMIGNGRSVALTDENGRYGIWIQTVMAISQSPWLGYGWNQTSVAQAKGAEYVSGTLIFSYAHNIVLDLLAWVGIPIGIILTLFIVGWFLHTAVRTTRTDGIYAVAMLLPLVVHSMLEFPFAYAYFLFAAGLLAGIAEASIQRTATIFIPTRMARYMCISLTFTVFYGAYEYLLIEEDYRVARFESLNVGRTPADYEKPTVLLHTQLSALLAALRQPAIPGMSPEELERLRQVSLRFGHSTLSYRYALALALNDYPQAAGQQLELIKAIFGERYYQAVLTDWQDKATGKYPQLGLVPSH